MMVALASLPVLQSGESKENNISPVELSRRIAIIKRFKELLKAQRDRFRTYLDSLDKQKDVIQNGTADDLLHYVDLEEKIVTDIFSIQKVIDPLEKMYSDAVSEPHFGHASTEKRHNSDKVEVTSLKDALKDLKAEALIRSERNKELLNQRMAEIRSEIKGLRSNPYVRRKSGIETAQPSRIDISG